MGEHLSRLGMNLKRGDIVLVHLDPVVGSEQGKTRPAIVIQNDIGNKFANTTIIAPVTSSLPKKDYPTDVLIAMMKGLPQDSVALLSQIRVIDKSRIRKVLGSVDLATMSQIDVALRVSLHL
jgi:mRNA interferase MazF